MRTTGGIILAALVTLAALALTGCSSGTAATSAPETTASRQRIDNPTQHDRTVASGFVHNVVDAARAQMLDEQDVTSQQYDEDDCITNYVMGQLPNSTITLIASIIDSGGAPASNDVVMGQVQNFADAGYRRCIGHT